MAEQTFCEPFVAAPRQVGVWPWLGVGAPQQTVMGGAVSSGIPLEESAKARQAWNDYLGMGAGRSLPKLAKRYKSAIESVPTRQLTTLLRWSAAFNWQARLDEIAAQEQAAIVARGIADKQNRVDALNDRWHRMQQVINERAEDTALQFVAGGRTGLIVHNVKGVGKGEDFQLIDLYEVDTGLLKELRGHEEQAAKELGQWVEKTEESGKKKIIVEYVNDWRGSEGSAADTAPRTADGAAAGETP